jgi:hypothetical protein
MDSLSCALMGVAGPARVRHTPGADQNHCSLRGQTQFVQIDLQKLTLKHWWTTLTAAGVAITLGGVAAKFPPVILVGLGLLLFGIGEWQQHPEEKSKNRYSSDRPYDRETIFLGLLIDLAGIALIAAGVSKLLQAQ